MQQFDLAELSALDAYSLMIRTIAPRPIAWVSTISRNGVVNLAPFSFFNGVGSCPPALAFSVSNHVDGSLKDTTRNIDETGEFVVNVVPFSLAAPMHQTSADYPSDTSELEMVGLTPLASVRVAPPRVAESPVHFECQLIETVRVGQGPLAANLIIGHILMIHVQQRLLDERGRVDPDKLDLIGRMGGASYAMTRDRFDLARATVNGWPSPVKKPD
jgi:flavin reductase (DIM6/NTAB) family NADH-FMN oxidoreductase RutF